MSDARRVLRSESSHELNHCPCESWAHSAQAPGSSTATSSVTTNGHASDQTKDQTKDLGSNLSTAASGPDQSTVNRRAQSIPLSHADIADLRRKLETMPTIEQAKGMLMGYYSCDADTAFAILRRWSSIRNVKLRVLCAELVAMSSQSGTRPFSALRAYLGGYKLN